MINIERKEYCCGCTACVNICPVGCIEMVTDAEGFSYPSADPQKCIKCSLCDWVCPYNQKNRGQADVQAYACKNKDADIQKTSSSGGFFSALSQEIIDQGGVVFGAELTDALQVRHTFAENFEALNRLKGSKYLQSKLGSSFQKVKEFLEQGRTVLFSGTPCQVLGLRGYLKKEYKNLIAVDIACHGVPSEKAFLNYTAELEAARRSKIKKIDFRNKKQGYKLYALSAEFENGKSYMKMYRHDPFMKGFIDSLYLRPSCGNCPAKGFTSGSDFTLADFWGCSRIHPEFYDDKGVSLVFVNSEKGQKYFHTVQHRIFFIQTDFEKATRHNKALVSSVKHSENRKLFFGHTGSFQKSVREYTKKSLKQNLREKAYITTCFIQHVASKIKNP